MEAAFHDFHSSVHKWFLAKFVVYKRTREIERERERERVREREREREMSDLLVLYLYCVYSLVISHFIKTDGQDFSDKFEKFGM